MTEDKKPSGPDLSRGVTLAAFKDSKLLGHVGEEDVLLVQAGSEIFAIEPTCSHYHGPLAEGLVVGDTIRCPWHHACFSLQTGEAIAAPALNAIPHYSAEVRDGKVFVRSGASAATVRLPRPAATPESVLIVGAGAAGNAAAEMLRRQGYFGPITMINAETEVPYDRPNLSKDYLAGNAPEEWIPLRPSTFYSERG